jgi:hypothetical protein
MSGINAIIVPGDSLAAPSSAVSWPAIIGGAVAAVAIALTLVTLGSGLGLAVISPWPGTGASAATFTLAAGIWLILVHWLASALGGYLAGRMRTRWVGTDADEVFFRDTAHGLLTWALASLIGAAVIGAATTSIIGSGTRAAATVASGAVQEAGTSAGLPAMARDYGVDSLFRGTRADMAASSREAHAEAARILANGIIAGDLPPADRAYLAALVATRTGLPQADAQKRVEDLVDAEKSAATKTRQLADTARKSASAVAIFLALAMLIGAFVASAAAAYGGGLRDRHP